MAAVERLLYYLKTIGETIEKRPPKTLEEAEVMLAGFRIIATEAVREESE